MMTARIINDRNGRRLNMTKDIMKIDEQEINIYIEDIMKSREISTLKGSIQSLMNFYERADSMHGYIIRWRFFNAVKEQCEAYERRTHGLKYNAVIIPPELSPTAMLPVYVKTDGNHYNFADGMNRLIKRCDEFTSPIHPVITEPEIRATLSAAQRAFGMMDIIAPNHPLRILRFNYSHSEKNSECGLMGGDSRQSVVFLYHPRQNDVCDRVFIFAHELGHALHFALTGDTSILPSGFDNFNDKFFTKFETPKAKVEGFADAAAIAILGSPNSRLKSHLPTQWSKDISPMFVRYFKELCNTGRS